MQKRITAAKSVSVMKNVADRNVVASRARICDHKDTGGVVGGGLGGLGGGGGRGLGLLAMGAGCVMHT